MRTKSMPLASALLPSLPMIGRRTQTNTKPAPVSHQSDVLRRTIARRSSGAHSSRPIEPTESTTNSTRIETIQARLGSRRGGIGVGGGG